MHHKITTDMTSITKERFRELMIEDGWEECVLDDLWDFVRERIDGYTEQEVVDRLRVVNQKMRLEIEILSKFKALERSVRKMESKDDYKWN